MNELVKRLREAQRNIPMFPTRYWVKEAADRIEALEAENARLMADAQRWRFYDKYAQASWSSQGVRCLGTWLVSEAVWKFGSRAAAIDAALKDHP